MIRPAYPNQSVTDKIPDQSITADHPPIETPRFMSSPIEVEFKFPVESLVTLRETLIALGAQTSKVSEQVDEYFNDPLRDFAKMDIALRIRQSDSNLWLTFKGPNLDPSAKIRTEIETPLVDQAAAEQIKQTFIGIGYFSVARVAKQRETLSLEWEGQHVEVCLDTVAEVGEFAELELVVESAAEQDAAKQVLESLADKLGLSGSIRTSYLELLLQSRGEI